MGLLGMATLSITKENVMLVTGLTWREVVKICAAQSVPIKRISRRRLVIDSAALMAAIRAMPSYCPAPSVPADDIDRLLIEVGLKR